MCECSNNGDLNKAAEIALVACGGAVGAICRGLLGDLFKRYVPSWTEGATLIVNIIGCFIMGLLQALLCAKKCSPFWLKPLLCVGLCGALTTFSSLAWDTLKLAIGKDHPALRASLNIVANLFLGAAAVCLGYFPISHYLNDSNSSSSSSNEQSSSFPSSADTAVDGSVILSDFADVGNQPA